MNTMKLAEWKMNWRIVSYIISALYCLEAEAQEIEEIDDLRQLIEERIEFLNENQIESQADYLHLFQSLEHYYNHPIQLNKASAAEWKELELLNEIQIQQLLKHIEKNGKLIAIEELQSIESFDLQIIRMIRPFCRIEESSSLPHPNLATFLHEAKSSLIIRSSRIIEEKKKSNYLGNPWAVYSRYRFQYYNRMSIGITAEKDPGEELFSGKQKRGFDFYSAHFYLSDYKKIKQLAIGDYQAQFGQGLTFWSGLAFGSGLRIGSLKRAAKGLIPYTSAQENQFLRGIGICSKFGRWSVTGFLSSRKLDGNITIDSMNHQAFISSIYGNGLHRTHLEIEKKNTIHEEIIGTHLEYHYQPFQIGFTVAYRRLNFAFESPREYYRKFDTPNQLQHNLGIDYSYYLANYLFYGEISRSSNGGMAFLNGLLWMPAKSLAIGIVQRNYGIHYRSLYSNALGSNSRNSNERGSYLNLEAKINPKISFQGNIDLYTFPWLTYQVDAPSNGRQFNMQLTYYLKKSTILYFRYQQKTREKNSRSNEAGLASIKEEKRANYRLHLSYQLADNLRLQSRIEWKSYTFEEDNELGFLMYQDLQYSIRKIGMRLTVRFSVFETDSYNSRIYAYENDLLYSFSIPPSYGVGSRYYILCKWNIKKGLELWLRYDQTAYLDRDSIGDGREEISDRKRSQFKSQLRFNF